MDFDNAKENIQPLSSGRDPSILHASITHTPQELFEKRREFEASIRDYNGIDPLEPWYNYISWIEQSFPSGGKESGLMEVLSKCLTRFESEERYYQDRRMIKLFIKFLDSRKQSTESYQELHNAGVGTMVADFYIAWAYCYDSVGNMRTADEIFRRGIECRAEPLDELKEAHQHFSLSVAQRTLYKDDDDALQTANRQIEERRSALSSLRGYHGRSGKTEIGSIRTGLALKSDKPGIIENNNISGCSKSSHNTRVSVLSDAKINPEKLVELVKLEEDDLEQLNETQSAGVIRSIVDKVREQENEIEPGPWNKVHNKNNAKALQKHQKCSTHDLGFSIHEDKDDEENSWKMVLADSELNYEKPFKYPSNFISKNSPQTEWIIPVTTECQPDPNTLPNYNKWMTYPRPNLEFQTEELCGYMYFKKRGIQNAYTQRYEMVWGNDITVPLRLYPNFARNSKPQTLDETDKFFVPPPISGMKVMFNKIYNEEKQEEFQNEELLAGSFQSNKSNKTVMDVEDMDETMCASSTNEEVQRRRSFFPMRRSLAIRSVITKTMLSDRNEHTGTNNINTQISSEIKERTLVPAKTLCQETQSLSLICESQAIDNANVCAQENRLLSQDTEPKTAIKNVESCHIQNSLNDKFEQLSIVSKNNNPIGVEFHFKPPALPEKSVKDSSVQEEPNLQNQASAGKKLSFEIYEEEDVKTGTRPETFDSDETFSTQVFNNFVKAQPASTPKGLQKSQKRQFGVLLTAPNTPTTPVMVTQSATRSSYAETNIFTDATTTTNSSNELISNTSPSSTEIEVEMPRRNSYSPQLSVILETSEHATTQGAHTTGASTGTSSTKSTNGSHESDIVDAAIKQTSIRETTCKQEKDVTELMSSINLTTKASMSENPISKQNDKAGNIAPEKFFIYEEATESFPQLPKIKLEGTLEPNFEHMVQREDTTSNCLFIRSSSCQEEKTETISKFVIPERFPLEEMDTFPTIHDSVFSNEMQQIPNVPCLNGPFFTETTQHNTNTGTKKKVLADISRLPLAKDESFNCYDTSDSFEIFRKSPPIETKYGIKLSHYPMRMDTELTSLKEPEANQLYKKQVSSTLTSAKSSSAKSHSQMDFQKFFENEMMSVDSDDNNKENKYAIENKERYLKKSAFSDISLIEQIFHKDTDELVKVGKTFEEKSQFLETQSNSRAYENSNARFNMFQNDSFLLDPSFIEETQPLKASNEIFQRPLAQKNMANYSLVKETSQLQADLTKELLSTNTSDVINEKDTKSMRLQQLKAFPPNYTLGEEKIPNSLDSIKEIKGNAKNPCLHAQENNKKNSLIPKRVISKSFLKETQGTPQNSAHWSITSNSEQCGMVANLSIDTSFIPETQEQPVSTNLRHSKTECNYYQSIFKEPTQQSLYEKCLPATETESNIAPKIIVTSNLERANISITKASHHTLIFELNAETETFSTGLSMIKNSTMLPLSPSRLSPKNTKIVQQIEYEKQNSMPSYNQQNSQSTVTILLGTDQDMSIYYERTPRTPLLKIHNKNWSDSEENSAQNDFERHEPDLNETAQRIHSMCNDQQVNPFNADLQNALLDNIDFVKFLNDLKNTMLVGRVPRLRANTVFKINDVEFKVIKLVGEGAYGSIFRGLEINSGKEVAFKQERPPNYWEYFICLEVQDRIRNEEILSAYMNIDYALIGNNASILVSPFSSYGSIITVCNKIKKITSKNVDEYVVMHLTCELLEIMDNLHAIGIIHADVKADNFLLMRKLAYNSQIRSLQLIDFGVSIDMKQFKETQTFTYIYNENILKCVEMRELRPWTYQLDLYGLAGVIHVLLLGKYMDIEKRANKGVWMPKTHMPRYINKLLWEHIFQTLLNVRDCSSMPNLQEIRARIKEEMTIKERYVINKIKEFNKAL